MPRWRPESVGRVIQEELSDLIKKGLRDPRLGYVTVTGVDVTRDLRTARVYISVMGDTAAQRESLDALTRATPFIRRELGQRLHLRHTPDLSFAYDDSIERGARINQILDGLKEQEGDPSS